MRDTIAKFNADNERGALTWPDPLAGAREVVMLEWLQASKDFSDALPEFKVPELVGA